MALINCPECGREISDTCKSCIHCGYSLQTSPAPLTKIAKKQINIGEVFTKYRKPIIAILSVIVLLVVVISISSANANRDPFEKLYAGQTRNSVRNALGAPDVSENEHMDEYDVKFLGKTGLLRIFYNDDIVESAMFCYEYPNTYPTDKDKDEANKYAESIIKYYTEKAGTPESENHSSIWWVLADGTEIGFKFELNPDKHDSVIMVGWYA